MRPLLPDLRKVLRNATADSHDRLDDLVSRFDLSTAEGYRSFLSLHAAVLLPAERWLEETGVVKKLPDWGSRARSAALRSDLEKLAVPLSDAPRRTPRLTYDNDLCSMAGTLYVMEGSRLGGRILLDRVSRADAGLPTAFLEHGAGRGLWPSFLAWLDRLPGSPDFAGGAVVAARRVFELYTREAQLRLPTRPYHGNLHE